MSAPMEFLFIFHSWKAWNKRPKQHSDGKKWGIPWIITDQTDTFSGNCATMKMAARNSTMSALKEWFRIHAVALLLWKLSNNNNYWKHYFMSLFHLISLFLRCFTGFSVEFFWLVSVSITYDTELLFNNDVIQLLSLATNRLAKAKSITGIRAKGGGSESLKETKKP